MSDLRKNDALATQRCPCGYMGDPKRECRCSSNQVAKYRQRVSGPLLDRIDLHVEVPSAGFSELNAEKGGEPSESIRERIAAAREIQSDRYSGADATTNAEMSTQLMREHCGLDNESRDLLEGAMTDLGLSARAHARILKVARTIADLAGSPNLNSEHLLEAIQYRTLDRALWA